MGAYFSKLNVLWTKHVRNATWLKTHPVVEVFLVRPLPSLSSLRSVAHDPVHRWNHIAFSKLVRGYNGFDLQKDFPAVYRYGLFSPPSPRGADCPRRWHNEIGARPAVSKVFAQWQDSLSS